MSQGYRSHAENDDQGLRLVEAEALARTWTDFQKLIRAYRRRETGYASRRAVFETRFDGDYDHLARFGEWDQGQSAAGGDVG